MDRPELAPVRRRVLASGWQARLITGVSEQDAQDRVVTADIDRAVGLLVSLLRAANVFCGERNDLGNIQGFVTNSESTSVCVVNSSLVGFDRAYFLAHCFAHIVLGHLTDSYAVRTEYLREELPDELILDADYMRQEDDADEVARCLVMQKPDGETFQLSPIALTAIKRMRQRGVSRETFQSLVPNLQRALNLPGLRLKRQLRRFDRTALLSERGELFLIDGNQRRPIDPTSVLHVSGQSLDQVPVVPERFLQSWSLGPPYRWARLVKSINAPEVFVLEAGQRRWVRTIEDFGASGFSWSDVKQVPQPQLDEIPRGADWEIPPAATEP